MRDVAALREHRLGLRSVLVEVDSTEQVRALHRAVLDAGLRSRELVPAARTLLVHEPEDPEALRSLLDRLRATRWSDEAVDVVCDGEPVEVPTTYDGPDLDEVARQWQMTRQEVVATHTGAEFVVAFCGFAPGFPYCTGLPGELSVSRRREPRTRVAPGSVGLAGEFTGVYPTGSPGGWQLVGRTELTLWDADREQPATLPPGTRVRFCEC